MRQSYRLGLLAVSALACLAALRAGRKRADEPDQSIAVLQIEVERLRDLSVAAPAMIAAAGRAVSLSQRSESRSGWRRAVCWIQRCLSGC